MSEEKASSPSGKMDGEKPVSRRGGVQSVVVSWEPALPSGSGVESSGEPSVLGAWSSRLETLTGRSGQGAILTLEICELRLSGLLRASQ